MEKLCLVANLNVCRENNHSSTRGIKSKALLMKYVPLFIFVAMFGCVADDFNNMAEGFSPPTPREAAIMAINQYDSDVRRHGITLLANSSFGGDSSIGSSPELCIMSIILRISS